MYKFVSVLFLIAAPCLFPQKTKGDNLNVYVTHASSLFASNVLDFHHLDFSEFAGRVYRAGWTKGTMAGPEG